jgi:histone chaperone ASF1
MASINILNIIPKNTTSKFTDPFSFEIIFEVLSNLKKEIEWKMIYIGSAEDKKYDQILETIEIDGPFHLGSMKFEFTGEAPDISKIPESEVLGVTAIILCCSYNNQEFFRCGYYLNNIYDNEEMNINPPEKVDKDRIIRSLLADKPRITRFDIDWDNENVDNVINENKTENENFMFKDGKMDIQQFNLMKDDKAGDQTTENTN